MENPKIRIEDLNLHYGRFHALRGVSLDVAERAITALIGPSGCGKSTLLRCMNGMNTAPGTRISGRILLDGTDVLRPGTDLCGLRKRVGMVFQRPNPFPLSVFENVCFGLRVAGERRSQVLKEAVERSLRAAWLWDQLRDKLACPAIELPMDQQQRLCVARLIAVRPDVILMDEPCSALDPIATARIEDLMRELREKYTILIVTHNMQQAARIADRAGYMLLGEMIEIGQTAEIFTNPRDARTQDYITGRYG